MKYLKEDDCLDMSTRMCFFLVISTADHAVSYTDKYLYKSSYLCTSKNEYLNFINPLDNVKKPFAKLLKIYLKNPRLLYEQNKKILYTLKNLRQTINKTKINKNNLPFLFEKYLQARFEVIRGVNVLRKLDRALDDYLPSQCVYLTKDDTTTLSYSSASSETTKEHLSILSGALRYKKNHSPILLGRLSQNLHFRYAPIVMGWHNEKPRTIAYYRKQILKWSKSNPQRELAKIHQEARKRLKQKRIVINKISRANKNLISLLPSLPLLKDEYRLIANSANFYFAPVFKYISQSFRITVDDIFRMSVEEIHRMLTTGVIPRKEINKRKKTYVYYSFQGKKKILYSQKAKKFIRNYYKATSILLPGRVASPGKARGKVTVVLSQADFPKFRKGGILVVINTTPDFVPLMRKAGAIVAEEGGITAHVSIVSRELGIPCVVGTKNATKILKDGDIVEVNANHNSVKIIKVRG